MTPHLTKSGFTGYFIKENGLLEDDFKEWVLYPEMLFRASDKWWGDRGKRRSSHEGLDLCFYRDHQDRISHITAGMKIPVLYEGVIAGVVNDFIGKSIIVKHHTPDNSKNEFYTMYGHTIPEGELNTGRTVGEGEIIARVAGLHESKAGILPHLHISIGVPVSGEISYDTLDWKDIGDNNKMTLIDPIQVIDRYSLTSSNSGKTTLNYERNQI
jgi:hypothetical protein